MTRRVWVLLFAGWSVVVWGSRIRNIWADDELSASGQVGRTLLALSFVAGGLAVAAVLVRAHGDFGRRSRVVVSGFAVWTVGVWILRGAQIIGGDHSVGFVVVHTVLAVVSIGLAAAAWRATRAPDGVSPELAGHR